MLLVPIQGQTAGAENGDEHALKWVIENVESLCEEYGKVAHETDDGKGRMHLELSTVKILDELEMPTINHAKREIRLLTRLLEALARLHQQCERLLDSSDVTNRLRSLREEMQKLFTLSPVCALKPLSRSKAGISVEATRVNQSSEDTSSTFAERTKTPTEEAMRPGHELDRTNRFSEMGEATLSRLRRRLSGKSDPTSDKSLNTKAIRAPSPSSARGDPDEQSLRIWVEEDLGSPVNQRMSTGSQPLAQNIRVSSSEDTDAVATPTSDNERDPNLLEVEDEPTIRKVQPAPKPSQAKVVPLPQMISAEVCDLQKRRSSQCVNRMILLGLAVIVVPLLLLWLGFFVFEWNQQCLASKKCDGQYPGVFLVMGQIICSLANTFCENYGICCWDYCASGLQRDKWYRGP